MTIFTPSTVSNAVSRLFALLITFTFFSNAQAQERNFGIAYSENLKGNTALFGNTLMHIVSNNGNVNLTKMNGNSANGNSSYGNNSENMQQVDIDGNSGVGAGTRNSSSANLTLPAGTNTIKLARLYWGGRVTNNDFNSYSGNKNIKVRFGTSGAYSELGALQLDSQKLGSYFHYQMYTDVTALVQANGTGTYTVGNAPLSTGSTAAGYYGGWSILVVYENASLPYSSVRVYDGFREVYNGGNSLTSTVTLTGLDVPSGALSNTDAKMGVVTWEGDAQLTNDFLKINGNVFSNTLNATNNPWNGTISD
ncbi:MAG: hypothetical protein ACOYKE_08250, partial [Ferruginibacter sp.]